jgi:hypothetical protein
MLIDEIHLLSADAQQEIYTLQARIAAYEGLIHNAIGLKEAYIEIMEVSGIKQIQDKITAKAAQKAADADRLNKIFRYDADSPKAVKPKCLEWTDYLNTILPIAKDTYDKIEENPDLINDIIKRHEPAFFALDESINTLKTLNILNLHAGNFGDIPLLNLIPDDHTE